MDAFRQMRQTGKTIKPSTINRDVGVLKHVCYWALDEKLITANPLARVRMARERRTPRQVLNISEEQKLLGKATGHLKPMIIMGLDTGMRRGEITSQRWEDIDFSRKLLFVTRSKTPEGESREIPLTDRLCELLLKNRKPEELVISYKGKPVRIVTCGQLPGRPTSRAARTVARPRFTRNSASFRERSARAGQGPGFRPRARTWGIFARTGRRCAGPRRAAWATALHRPSGATHRLLGMDRKTDSHSPRASVLPVHGERQTDLLRRAGCRLDRKPTKGENQVSLYKRGDKYSFSFWVGGVRYGGSTGTTSPTQAKRIENKQKEEIINQRFQLVGSDPNMTFGEVAKKFAASSSVRPHHIYHLKFLRSFFSEIVVLRLTKSLADEFRKARRARNPAIKDATINRDLSVLRHILYWALDERLISVNPLARMKMARERRTSIKVLSVSEEQNLESTPTPPHMKSMWVMGLYTGMRRGEITSQRWEDIDFSRKVLFVTRSKTPEGESREIPLTDRLYELLLQSRKAEGLVISYKGKPVRIVKRAWKTALKNAGIRHVRFHDLRHTFNTRLMEAGVMQEVRMALMGHSSGSKVHATYTHIELPVKREAIRKLEDWVNIQIKTEKENKEKHDASTESKRTESAPGKAGQKALEEKVAGRSGLRAGRQAARRDRRDGGGVESQTQTAAKV